MATDEEIFEAAERYRKFTGKEPSMAWYAEQGDSQARHLCDAMGFAAMAVMATAIVVMVITTIRFFQGTL